MVGLNMDLDGFFNDLQEKTWKNHTEFDASKEFKDLIEYLEDNRDLIIEDVLKSIQKMELLKLEDNEEFSYKTYKKWLNKFMANYIIEKIIDKDR
jgi:hypothetical protein